MRTLHTLGGDFLKRHGWLVLAAKRHNIALCGGCAAAVLNGREDYVPKDIDFAAKQSDALAFINSINSFLLGKVVHYRVYVNSRNGYVPSAATAHFRVTCPFWLPICIFIIPDDKFRAYRIKGGHWMQIYSDIKQAADELTELDEKPRIASEPERKDAAHEEAVSEDEPDPATPDLHDIERAQDWPFPEPLEEITEHRPTAIGSSRP